MAARIAIPTNTVSDGSMPAMLMWSPMAKRLVAMLVT